MAQREPWDPRRPSPSSSQNNTGELGRSWATSKMFFLRKTPPLKDSKPFPGLTGIGKEVAPHTGAKTPPESWLKGSSEAIQSVSRTGFEKGT